MCLTSCLLPMSCSKSVESGLCLVFSGGPYRMKRPQPGACNFVKNQEPATSSRTMIGLNLRLFPFCSPYRFQSQSALGFCLAIPPQISSTSSDSFSFSICFLRWCSLLSTIASDCIGLALNNQGVHDYIACRL